MLLLYTNIACSRGIHFISLYDVNFYNKLYMSYVMRIRLFVCPSVVATVANVLLNKLSDISKCKS